MCKRKQKKNNRLEFIGEYKEYRWLYLSGTTFQWVQIGSTVPVNMVEETGFNVHTYKTKKCTNECS